MRIYLIRHGIAEDNPSLPHLGDEGRALTAEGIEKFRKTAEGLKRLGLEPTHIFTSPLLRAQQTCALLVEALATSIKPVVTTSLKPEAMPRPFPELLGVPTDAEVILVGHLPHLPTLASWLMTGHGGLDLALKKGGVILLEMRHPEEGGTATLIGVWPPRSLRLLVE